VEGDRAPAAKQCQAAVALSSAARSCPTATLHFGVEVTGCARSSGTFAYAYLLVSETRKEKVTRAVSWRSDKPRGDASQVVPIACDEEIDDVEITEVTSCTCSPRSTSVHSSE
jgi:hypothetical protein